MGASHARGVGGKSTLRGCHTPPTLAIFFFLIFFAFSVCHALTFSKRDSDGTETFIPIGPEDEAAGRTGRAGGQAVVEPKVAARIAAEPRADQAGLPRASEPATTKAGTSSGIGSKLRPGDNGRMSQVVSIAPKRPARISSKLREAIRLRVEEGLSIAEATEKAGISRAGWHKAMKRPEVRDLFAEVQASFVASADAKRALYRARALEVALDLMLNAKSESIRARMCEFLAADAKVSPVAVHVDARTIQPAGGYYYPRPDEVRD